MSKVIAGRRLVLMPFDNDPFSILNKLIYPCAVRDRFGILNDLSPFNWSSITDEIPQRFDEIVALGTLMDKRMANILAMHPNAQFVAAWSGGVDSTALLCAYLRAGADIDRMTVICTEDSIEEYPFFYELLKKLRVKIQIVDSVTKALSEVDCDVILTGWCADQMFGSDVNTKNIALYNEPWLDALRVYSKEQRHIEISKQSLEHIEAVYTEYARKLTLPVEQWCEFLWMLNFGCKWTYVQNETNLSLAGTKNYGKVINFYEDISFQRWSISRFEKLRLVNPHINNVRYKKALKQYILNYTGDQMYYRTKGKMATRSYQTDELEYVAVLTEDGLKKYHTVYINNSAEKFKQAISAKFRKAKQNSI